VTNGLAVVTRGLGWGANVLTEFSQGFLQTIPVIARQGEFCTIM